MRTAPASCHAVHADTGRAHAALGDGAIVVARGLGVVVAGLGETGLGDEAIGGEDGAPLRAAGVVAVHPIPAAPTASASAAAPPPRSRTVPPFGRGLSVRRATAESGWRRHRPEVSQRTDVAGIAPVATNSLVGGV